MPIAFLDAGAGLDRLDPGNLLAHEVALDAEQHRTLEAGLEHLRVRQPEVIVDDRILDLGQRLLVLRGGVDELRLAEHAIARLVPVARIELLAAAEPDGTAEHDARHEHNAEDLGDACALAETSHGARDYT